MAIETFTTSEEILADPQTQQVVFKWNDELKKWMPTVIDIMADIQSGEIKTTWKTHLVWAITTILGILGTWLGIKFI